MPVPPRFSPEEFSVIHVVFFIMSSLPLPLLFWLQGDWGHIGNAGDVNITAPPPSACCAFIKRLREP